MKKILLGAFYASQGVGNLVLGLLFIRGGLGVGGVFVDIFLRPLFVAVSCLSLLAALSLFLRRENLAQVFGEVSSVFFCMFYGMVAVGLSSYPYIGLSQSFLASIMLILLSIVIIVLNVLSVFVLRYKKEGRRMKNDEGGGLRKL